MLSQRLESNSKNMPNDINNTLYSGLSYLSFEPVRKRRNSRPYLQKDQPANIYKKSNKCIRLLLVYQSCAKRQDTE
jgi:hypothetical protein